MCKILGSPVSVYETEDIEKPPINCGVLISITADGIFIIMKESGHCFCSIPEFTRIHTEEDPPPFVMPKFIEPPATNENFSRINKKATIKYCKKLRKKGGTFKEIARLLNNSDVPTFSGNGKWFAQTIHRLCDSKD